MSGPEALSQPVPSALVQGRAVTARGGSIRRRISLLIGLVMAVVGVTSSWLAYREVENVLRASGHERIAAAATQLAELLAQSATARTTETRRLASDPAVQELARSSDLAGLPPPPAILKASFGRAAQGAVWFYGADGRAIARLLPHGESWTAPDSADAPVPAEGIGPLYLRASRPGYRSTAPIRAAGAANDAVPVGFISIDRSLGASPGRGLIERLIGSGAVLKLGNATGEVWTDLGAPVAAPPVGAPGQPVRYTSSDGVAHLGTAVQIHGTPWLIWAEFPEASWLQPASNLLKRLTPLLIVAIVVGAIAVYGVAARITTPLEQLAQAAESLAAGDFSQRVDTSSRPTTTSSNPLIPDRLLETLSRASERWRRHSVEEALRQTEERSHLLLESITDVVAVLDEEGFVNYSTASLERTLGYSLGADDRRMSAFEIIHPEDLEKFKPFLGALKRIRGATQSVDLRLRHRDGAWRAMACQVTNLYDRPAIGGFLMTARDVTEAQQLERQFRQAQKMELVGNLAGGIAHDFNNLLTAILGYSELLLSRPDFTSESIEDLEEIRRAGQRAVALTRQLLAFSRQQPTEPKCLNLGNMLKDLARITGEAHAPAIWGLPLAKPFSQAELTAKIRQALEVTTTS